MPPRRKSNRLNNNLPPSVVIPPVDPIVLEQIIAQKITEALVSYESSHNNNGHINNSQGSNIGIVRDCTYKYFYELQVKEFLGK